MWPIPIFPDCWLRHCLNNLASGINQTLHATAGTLCSVHSFIALPAVGRLQKATRTLTPSSSTDCNGLCWEKVRIIISRTVACPWQWMDVKMDGVLCQISLCFAMLAVIGSGIGSSCLPRRATIKNTRQSSCTQLSKHLHQAIVQKSKTSRDWLCWRS